MTLTPDERLRLTRTVFRILDAWQVPARWHAQLLGLSPHLPPRKFRRHRLGQPLPDEREVYQRVELLLKIDNAVQQLFPHSELSANLWVTTPRLKLGNHTPLQMMLEHGIEGMREIERGLYNLAVW